MALNEKEQKPLETAGENEEKSEELSEDKEVNAISFMIDVMNYVETEMCKKSGAKPLRFAENQLIVGDAEFRFPPKYVKALENEFKGLRIRSTHRPDDYRTHRICDLRNPPCVETFLDKAYGGQRTVSDYFSQRYPGTIKYPGLPCLNIGTVSKPNSTPMDVAVVICSPAVVEKYSVKTSLDKNVAEIAPSNRTTTANVIDESRLKKLKISKDDEN